MGTSTDVTLVNEVESKFETLRYLNLIANDEDSKLSDKYDSMIVEFVKSECEEDRKPYNEPYHDTNSEINCSEILAIYKNKPYAVKKAREKSYHNGEAVPKLHYPSWLGDSIFLSLIMAVVCGIFGLVTSTMLSWISWKSIMLAWPIISTVTAWGIHKLDVASFESQLMPLTKYHYDRLLNYINSRLDAKIGNIKNQYSLKDGEV